ncbi:hypothetical protein AKJ59_00195 [candidate division MSBL1 archaeon SCGC-AAA385M02]|uniref:Uncharacterized protein n=1 Tax=candidate division MSBL1 archaeon SCGC-AAA385M02 TaxID=1698287 RepID=A0A133VR52_9EURY|nr:hypothetical protein AKJ59_00195 [candidate division MSBL1 archaeon SCGC-AAA385M02]
MNFREAVKRVHPDINPDMVDAGDKMRVLTTHKNEPRKIYMWMRKWGLVGITNSEKQEPLYNWFKVNTLTANSMYNGAAIVRHKNGTFYKVYKTTKKRAYFMGNSDGRKFCHVNSVTDAWIKKEV